MSRLELSLATAEDCREAMRRFSGVEHPIAMRIVGIAGRIDGKLVGVGGVQFRHDGHRTIFLDIGEEGRRHPIALHKGALKVIELAKQAKVKRLIATTTSMHPRSPAWLTRLGFRHITFSGGSAYVRDL